jgi:hypothetical protein
MGSDLLIEKRESSNKRASKFALIQGCEPYARVATSLRDLRGDFGGTGSVAVDA